MSKKPSQDELRDRVAIVKALFFPDLPASNAPTFSWPDVTAPDVEEEENDFVVVTPPNSNSIDQAAPLAPNPSETRVQPTDSDNTISAADKEVERRSHERIAQLGAQERATFEARGGGSNTKVYRAEETIGNEVDARSTRTSPERFARSVDPDIDRRSREQIAQLVALAREEAIRAARSVDADRQAPEVDVKTSVDREVSSSGAAGASRVQEIGRVSGEDVEVEKSRVGENAVEITGVRQGTGAGCAC
jgi:hypothetical protein